MLASMWRMDDARSAADYAVLALIGVAVLVGGLLALGGMLAPFIISAAYAQAALVPAIVVGVIGALLGVYLRGIGMTLSRDRNGLGLIVLFAIIGFFAVDYGVPATLGSLSSTRGMTVFTISRISTGGGRSGCYGVYVVRPDYQETRLCGVRGEPGMHVEVTGKMSGFGIVYTKASVTP